MINVCLFTDNNLIGTYKLINKFISTIKYIFVCEIKQHLQRIVIIWVTYF